MLHTRPTAVSQYMHYMHCSLYSCISHKSTQLTRNARLELWFVFWVLCCSMMPSLNTNIWHHTRHRYAHQEDWSSLIAFISQLQREYDEIKHCKETHICRIRPKHAANSDTAWDQFLLGWQRQCEQTADLVTYTQQWKSNPWSLDVQGQRVQYPLTIKPNLEMHM